MFKLFNEFKLNLRHVVKLQSKYRSWHERVPFASAFRLRSIHIPPLGDSLSSGGLCFERAQRHWAQNRTPPDDSGTQPDGMRMECKRNADAKRTRSCQERYFHCKWNSRFASSLRMRPNKFNSKWRIVIIRYF